MTTLTEYMSLTYYQKLMKYTKEIGSRIKEADTVKISFLTDLIMKVNGSTTNKMDLAEKSI